MKVCSVWTAGDFRAKKCIGYKFLLGLEKHGYSIDQHYPALLDVNSPPYGDLVVANGFRSPIKEASASMKKRGIDTIVYDLGYLDRSDTRNDKGYYQMGWNRIGWVPPFECPPDRFNNLGIKVKPMSDNGSKVILVCAQKFNDGQHGMSAWQMEALMTRVCKEYRAQGYQVYFKSHPKSPFDIEGFESIRGPMERVFEEIKPRFVVTYNSTAGVDAIINGVPVRPLSEDAHYYELAAKLDCEGTLELPTQEAISAYLHRLAYAQWKLDEVEEGYPFAFLFNAIEGRDPFSGGANYTGKQGSYTPVYKDKIEIDGMKFFEAKALVRAITGESARNKEELEKIVGEYNEKI